MTDDQKRALGIGGAAVGGLLLWRHFHRTGVAAGTTLTNGLAQSSSPVGSTTPFVPQSPVVVPPGESIYDPNSQALLNTPTAVPTPQATTPAGPSYVVNVTTPKTHATKKKTVKPTKRPVKHKGNVKK